MKIKPMIPEAEGSKPQIINCKNELTRKNCLCNILKNLLKNLMQLLEYYIVNTMKD